MYKVEVRDSLCADGVGSAFASLFRNEAEESMAVAIASLLLAAAVDSDCVNSITIDACAEAGECVASNDICSVSGNADESLKCCQEADVCAQLPNSPVFRCESRVAAQAAGAEILDC